ncbi:Na+/H+ antiporter NhaC [Paenibacillus apiarius]|uniref:Na+/H+ antiporter NhaC n=1 Tax=Paenibacillus apiarius TaxID=46240 RepID=A0ABT4DN02_9BACL|nr:Na+/H+ antiporter NhaC [Paenibacillus apiarius]MCY9514724.1 Na+/H+ antiporter NhaC [Paenibacillus apiarius]MCY9518714.1 Na+/H+ antiporter NhaC [Paenibacillus apiarius]MCY9552845.1 Na+/H+ antiporter NhaC [Paenibacillus apiarius]MCY9556870.1 Na+/H+ antiporter NhaC [Paenibacillus apiarius]MCY9686177.1 Na+/H+ antiporter NhaC [Paenibacillus apiarius]
MRRQVSTGLAILPILALISAGAASIFIWKAGMFIPLVIGIIVTVLVGVASGYRWDELQQMMVNGVAKALPAIFILLVIGMIVGTWISSGVIPAMIYYGLSFIHPSFFVPAVAIVTGIVAVTLGSSFTSIATIGLAFMVIGEGMGFSPGLIAGAVMSGAFFGDKLSPLSDTTNIAPAMAETDLFSHVRHMLWDTIPAFIITVVLYSIFSNGSNQHVVETDTINVILSGIQQTFTIHPLLLLLPVLTIFLMIRRLPALPTLLFVGLLGGILSILIQDESVTSMVNTMTNGFHAESGVKEVDSLLNRGGIVSMLNTIGLLTIATALGGLLEGANIFQALIRPIVDKIKTPSSLIATTIVSTLIVAFASGAQFLAIILPTRTFVQTYKDLNIDTKNLSRCVEAAGTVGITLVPWGVPAVFAANMLGVSPEQFIPYLFFAFLVPLINIIYGMTGWTIVKKEYPNHGEQVTTSMGGK